MNNNDETRCDYCGGFGYTVKPGTSGTQQQTCPECDGRRHPAHSTKRHL